MLRYMSLIIPAGYAQLVLGFTCPNLVTGRGAITMGFGATIGPAAVSFSDWVDGWFPAFQDVVPDLFDTSVTFDSIYVQNETSSYQVNIGVTGGQAFTDPPPNVAVLAVYKTEAKGRRARGRNFLYGVTSEGEINSAGNLDEVRRSGIETNWGYIRAEMITAGGAGTEQVILQNTTPTGPGAPANPTPPITPPPVVNVYSIASKVATQRRRLRR